MLTHIPDKAETVDDVLPSQVQEREGVSPRISMAEAFKSDPDVAACIAEVEELVSIDALPEAISSARRRLHDAIGHAQSVAARERAARLKVIEHERRAAEAKRLEAETARRQSAETPTVTLVFNSVRVVILPEWPSDPGLRGQIGYALGKVYRMIARDWAKPRDPKLVAAECSDLLRFVIRLGAATVEVIDHE